MPLIRWILLLPVVAVVIIFLQVSWALLSQQAPWWISVPIVFTIGGALNVSIVSNVMKIAPKPRPASISVLTLFLLFESMAIVVAIGRSDSTAAELIVRFASSVQIAMGILLARMMDSEAKMI